ncbi:TPA: YfjI family protein [Pseudomonas aeruginosa]|jgi:hypothetical protein|uniref:YfjI family protein n=1 Tax=Pseudomonas aeruginosa TaxID=287 RepID=UPI001053C113|nr:YfjI family protein [Pseudomonas aeruginosa]
MSRGQPEWGNTSLRNYQDPAVEVDFDLDNLKAFPMMMGVVRQISRELKVPVGVAVLVYLGVLSLVCQGLIDVRTPAGRCAVSLIIKIIMESGARKTTIVNLLTRVLRDFQIKVEGDYLQALDVWKVADEIHRLKLKKLKRALANVEPETLKHHELTDELSDLIRARPVKPKSFNLMFSKGSIEALVDSLYDGYSSVGLMSGEGGDVLNGGVIRDYVTINEAWSGQDIRSDTVKHGRRVIVSPRIMMLLLVQEEVLNKYIRRQGVESKGAGLWARALIAKPISLIGQRHIENFERSDLDLTQFESRVTELLELAYSKFLAGNLSRTLLEFSDGSKDKLVEIFNAIESASADGGPLEKCRDHASKLAENISRVAALVSFFERNSLEVDEDCLEFAESICMWCSPYYAKYYSSENKDEINAEKLLRFLKDKKAHLFPYARTDIYYYGPHGVRTSEAVGRALDFLHRQGLVRIYQDNKINYVEVCSYEE